MNYSNKSNWSVIESYFKEGHLHQLVKHQIDSYNDFIQTQIFKTIEMFNPLIVHSPHDYFPKLNKYRLEIEITFQNLCIYRPEIHENNGSTKLMFPNKARLRNCTYTSHFTLDLNIKYIIIKIKNGNKKKFFDNLGVLISSILYSLLFKN